MPIGMQIPSDGSHARMTAIAGAVVKTRSGFLV